MPAHSSCPYCGTDGPLEIVYGLPIAPLMDDPDIVLGGCMVTPDDPAWRCRNPMCGREFGLVDELN